MVRDVRDHTFSTLDCLWSFRRVYILPQPTRQYKLMSQRGGQRDGLDTNALGQWFEPPADTIVSQSLT